MKNEKFVNSIFLSAGLIACSSCSTISKLDPSNVQPPSANSLTIEKVLNLNKADAAKFITDQDISKINKPSIESMMLATASVNNPLQRSAFGALMIKASDDECNKYMTSITQTEKSIRTGLGTAGLLLSSAAGLATPVDSANILSGLSAAAQGLETEIADTVLGGEDGYILAEAVKKGRKTERTVLMSVLEGRTEGKSYISFMSEFSNYHDNCGIAYGQQIIRKALDSGD